MPIRLGLGARLFPDSVTAAQKTLNLLALVRIQVGELYSPRPFLWAGSFTEWTKMQGFECHDCDIDTSTEYYMVHDRLWNIYGVGDGMLCIGCLERRVGHELDRTHFTPAPVNEAALWNKSDRLRDRLTR